MSPSRHRVRWRKASGSEIPRSIQHHTSCEVGQPPHPTLGQRPLHLGRYVARAQASVNEQLTRRLDTGSELTSLLTVYCRFTVVFCPTCATVVFLHVRLRQVRCAVEQVLWGMPTRNEMPRAIKYYYPSNEVFTPHARRHERYTALRWAGSLRHPPSAPAAHHNSLTNSLLDDWTLCRSLTSLLRYVADSRL